MQTTLTALCLAVIGQGVPMAPQRTVASAAADLFSTPSQDRSYTRYLALEGIARPQDRPNLARAVLFWSNSLSLRRSIARMKVVGDGKLLKLDTRDFGWDKDSRAKRLADLKAAGVTVSASSDPWEELAKEEPYYRATALEGDKLVRGWIDPQLVLGVKGLSGSERVVSRADWFLARTALDAPLGRYSDFLMLPSKEADVYRAFGADETRVERERLSQGGAVLTSIVALHNRELELLPSMYGHDDRFIWRTYDTINNLAERSVLENFVGSVHADGREFIGSLPNGLHWYYLANAAGVQVGEVPTNIAQDKQDGYDARVINSYKCVGCHSKGINDFSDVVSRLAVGRNVGLAVTSKDKADLAIQRAAVEDYYLSPLGLQIKRHQDSYAARVQATNAMSPGANAANFVAQVNRYLWGRVDLATAAREFGLNEADARRLLADSAEPEMLAITEGQTAARESFQAAWPEAMRSRTYPWDH